MQKVMLINPPFTQLNTPYPATVYLKGFLNTQKIPCTQHDLGIEVFLKLFSKSGLRTVFDAAKKNNNKASDNARRVLSLESEYINTIDDVILFLQNRNSALVHRIITRKFLPEALRFEQIPDLQETFGVMGQTEKAKFLATLYLEDIGDLLVELIDPNFGFTKYAEQLGRSAHVFDEIYEKLYEQYSIIDDFLISTLNDYVLLHKPTVVGISIAFPGNLLGGLRCGMFLKKSFPEIKVVLGGGFPNTELRQLTDVRVFECTDYICLDDGEAPLLNLLQYFDGSRSEEQLKRTFLLKNGKVVFVDNSETPDFKQLNVGVPDYSDLPINNYVSVIEVANPMHSLWSNGRWNKLTIAHGCYWAKCSFCDTTLDYIGRYEPNSPGILANRIEQIIAQTGETGFHFVDEAAPPALLKELAIELIRRKITITWWANIRFENNFSYDVCRLLRRSGCIAVTGGLEVASERILKLINKGVSIEQVAKVAHNFTSNGIMVHAYLMYGFPTQTAQETIDSLEIVRQLFQTKVLYSAYWHRFALTVHSPVGKNPEKFQLSKVYNINGSFANNDVEFEDHLGTEHEKFGYGLRKALYNYMHSACFDFSMQEWFDFPVPKTTHKPNLIANAISEPINFDFRTKKSLTFIGILPFEQQTQITKKGKTQTAVELVFPSLSDSLSIKLKPELSAWIITVLQACSANNGLKMSVLQFEKSYTEAGLTRFDEFIESYAFQLMHRSGLLFI